MKIPVMELGNKKKTDSVFLKGKQGQIVLILKYNTDELLKSIKDSKDEQ